MVSNRDLEDYSEWEKRRSSLWVNLQKSMNATYIIGLVIVILFGIYLAGSSGMNKNLVYGGIVVVALAVIYRSMKKDKEREEIPEPIAKVIAWLNMTRSIGKELPPGTQIIPLVYCRMRFEGEWGQAFRPWKWEVGMRIIYPDFRKEDVLVIMNPYSGQVTGKVKKVAGYLGDESHDMKVILPTQFELKKDKGSDG